MAKYNLLEADFENVVCEKLESIGWTHVEAGDIHREYRNPILDDDLETYLKGKYDVLSDQDIEYIKANIKNVGGNTSFEALRNTYTLYRDGYVYKLKGTDELLQIDYIDFEHPENNIYKVVNQFIFKQGNSSRRPDVLLFINGLPIAIFELKNPTDIHADIREAHAQVTTRYTRDIPALLKYCALAVVSDGVNTRLGTCYSGYEYFYAWKKVENEDKPSEMIDELDTMLQGVFKPERLLEILRDYIYFPDPVKNGENRELEVICRYPQFFATRMLRDNIIKHCKSGSCNTADGKGGLYFGATGCGKTFTMLFLARQLALRCREQLGSPTIILIVDREDLQNQAASLFYQSRNYLRDDEVKIFVSREELSDQLSLRKSGGFYITTIQKFAESTGLLSERSNIICMSDEAHRTQNNLNAKLKVKEELDSSDSAAFITYGFAHYLRTALPNATYVGFTGTPTDESVRVFGGVVDSYTMMQSVRDKITVPIVYSPRLSRVMVNKEQADLIENYYAECSTNGISIEEIRKSKQAMAHLSEIIGNDDRIERVALDIITDYEKRQANDPKQLQKAMITCCDRNIAYKLYQYIKKYRFEWCEEKKALSFEEFNTPEEYKLLERRNTVPYLCLVATRNNNDKKELYDLLGDNKKRQFLASEFKKKNSNFHIAIVVDMWITGFDCQPLTILYNDKPLKKHTLIQTISRVNRTYPGKERGYIVDYIGIRNNMQEAMQIYGNEAKDTAENEGKSYNIFCDIIKVLQGYLHNVDLKPFFGNDKAERLKVLQNAAEYILANSVDKKGEKSLKREYKNRIGELKLAYNICNPAGLLSKEEIEWAVCFMGIQSFITKLSHSQVDITGMNIKVQTMIRDAIVALGIESLAEDQKEESIFGEDFWREVSEVRLPHTKFQILLSRLKYMIKNYGKINRVKSEEFTDMLLKVVEEYNTRDDLHFVNDVVGDTMEALTAKLIDIYKAVVKDRDQFKELGITFEEKAFFDILVSIRDKHGFQYEQQKCIRLAKKIKILVDDSSRYSDWINNSNIRNQLSFDLVNLLYMEGFPPEWSKDVYDQIIIQVSNYKSNKA